MSAIGPQGGITPTPDEPAVVSTSGPDPARPDHNVSSTVAPPALPSFPGSPNRAK